MSKQKIIKELIEEKVFNRIKEGTVEWHEDFRPFIEAGMELMQQEPLWIFEGIEPKQSFEETKDQVTIRLYTLLYLCYYYQKEPKDVLKVNEQEFQLLHSKHEGQIADKVTIMMAFNKAIQEKERGKQK